MDGIVVPPPPIVGTLSVPGLTGHTNASAGIGMKWTVESIGGGVYRVELIVVAARRPSGLVGKLHIC